MRKSGLTTLAAAGALMLSAAVFSTPAASHQTQGQCDSMEMGHMSMMSEGHIGMMGHMPMTGGGHMGKMGHMPMMGGGHMGMMSRYKGLGLSDEQQQKINDIQHGLRKKHWEIMGQMIDQQAALQKAYSEDRPDPKTVGAVYGKIFDLKRQMIEAALAAKNGVIDVLTEEQLAQMKKMHHRHHEMTSGQHGMMHGQGNQPN